MDQYSPVTKPNGSCNSCRRRKLKCDRAGKGCSSCAKADIPCIYPATHETTKRKRGPYHKDKTQRERELEHAVKAMEAKYDQLAQQLQKQEPVQLAQPETEARASAPDYSSPSARASPTGVDNSPSQLPPYQELAVELTPPREKPSLDTRPCKKSPSESDGSWPTKEHLVAPLPVRPRNRFWSNFSKDVNGLIDDNFGACAPEMPSHLPPGFAAPTNHHGIIFGPQVATSDLKSLHPPSSHVFDYWNIYTAQVDPMLRILHVPSFTKSLLMARDNILNLDKGMEALMFSIYFAAVTSSPAAEIEMQFGRSKEGLLQQYKYATEMALIHAGFLTSRSLLTLQALTIYLLCIRNYADGDMLWTLMGIAVRVAQLMDLPWDGTRFNLPPLEIELRRRLWWTIRRLESRCAEENGFQPASPNYFSDTKFPLNINDQDIGPESKELPLPRTGFTGMTFCLIGFEMVDLISRINQVHINSESSSGSEPSEILDQKLVLAEECETKLQSTYLQHCCNSRPFDWMTMKFTNLMMTKVRLLIYHPFGRPMSKPLDPQIKDETFSICVEIMELSHALKSEPQVDRWAWFFRNYVQWHALAFVLGELSHRTGTPTVDRACTVLNRVLRDWGTAQIDQKHSALWHSMNKLIVLAREVREADLKSRCSQSNQAPLLSYNVRTPQNDHPAPNSSLISGANHNNYNYTTAPLNDTSFSARMDTFDMGFDAENSASEIPSQVAVGGDNPPMAIPTPESLGDASGARSVIDLHDPNEPDEMEFVVDGLSTQDWIDIARTSSWDFESLLM